MTKTIYWYEHRSKKKAKNDFEKDFFLRWSIKFFTENLLAIEMKKAEILTNKLIHLRLSILELSEILIMSFVMIM